jgi:hypothetical protein
MSGNKRYYRGKAKEWAMSEASTGKPMLVVLFDVLTEGATEKSLTWRGFFTDATADRTIESLRAMGFEGDDLSTLEGLDKNEVDLVVEDEEYTDPETGQVRAVPKVQWVNRPRALSVKTVMEGDKLRSFAAEMKARFRAVDAAAGKRTPSKPAAAPAGAGPKTPEPPPLTDADMPF